MANKQQKFKSHSSEAGKSKIKALACSVLGEGLSWFTGAWLFTITSHGRRNNRSFWGLFYQGTNPIHGDSASWPHHLPKVPPPNTITWGLGWAKQILQGTHSVYSNRKDFEWSLAHIKCIFMYLVNMYHASCPQFPMPLQSTFPGMVVPFCTNSVQDLVTSLGHENAVSGLRAEEALLDSTPPPGVLVWSCEWTRASMLQDDSGGQPSCLHPRLACCNHLRLTCSHLTSKPVRAQPRKQSWPI